MLTKEQKAEKIKRKFERDSKKEVKACLFRIENLSHKKNRFKIDRNAQQLYLTGVCIMMKKNLNLNLPSLVYVEGGPLSIKKFKTLLLRRIKWSEKKKEEDKDESKSEEVQLKSNHEDFPINPECLLVWEGNVKKRYYEKWKMTEVKSENDVKKILQEKGIDHFWNSVISYKLDNIK
jgi:U4/U6 small nuclear ribonucleoprotein PRP3